MTTDTRHQVLLHLDLAEENPIPLSQVRAHLSGAADLTTYRISEFGAERTETGTREHRWIHWARAFERMLAAATADEEVLDLHITGRAAQPIVAYAGLRLAGTCHRLTVHSPRRGTGEFDSIRVSKVDTQQAPFFPIHKVHERGEPTGMVALFVGMGQPFDPNTARRFLQARGTACAGIVELNTPGDTIQLGEDNAPAAFSHLRRAISEVQREFPDNRGVSVFLACPFTMAFALGHAFNGNANGKIWLPVFLKAKKEYRWALHYPRAAPRNERPRILVMTAAPQNEAAIDVTRENRALRDALQSVHGRFELDMAPDFRNRDFIERISAFRPDIVHILCHGGADGTIAATTDDDKRRAKYVALEEIIGSFRELDLPPRVVVFNACFSSKGAKELLSEADTTIGACIPLAQTTAAALTREFYGALARGRSVRQAFAEAKKQLGMDDHKGAESIDIYHAPEGDRGAWEPFPC